MADRRSIFVPGCPKAGSSSLASALVASGYESGFTKEPAYYLRYGDPVIRRQAIAAGYQGERRLDATPRYLERPEILDAIVSDDVWGTIDIVVLVRRPIDQAVSHYLDQVRAGYERRPARSALSPWSGASIGPLAHALGSTGTDRLVQWVERAEVLDAQIAFTAVRTEHLSDVSVAVALADRLGLGALTIEQLNQGRDQQHAPWMRRLRGAAGGIGVLMTPKLKARWEPTLRPRLDAGLALIEERTGRPPRRSAADVVSELDDGLLRWFDEAAHRQSELLDDLETSDRVMVISPEV